eukprot:441820-Amphidinium_carterae.1
MIYIHFGWDQVKIHIYHGSGHTPTASQDTRRHWADQVRTHIYRTRSRYTSTTGQAAHPPRVRIHTYLPV